MTHYKYNKLTSICQALIIFFLLTLLTQPYAFSQSKTKIYTSTEAINHIGEFASVKGKVYQVYISRIGEAIPFGKGTIFLNIDGIYPNNPFSAVIFNSDAPKFTNIRSLEGKTIIVTGLIRTYQGKPEIIIKEPNQIKIIK